MEYKVGGIEILLNKAENQKLNTSWILLYVRSGCGMYNCSGRMKCLDEGELLLLPPGVQPAFDSDSLGDEYNASLDAAVVRFGERWLDVFLQLFPAHSDTVLALRERRYPSRITGTKWLKISGIMDSMNVSAPQRSPILLLEIFDLLSDPSDIHPIDYSPTTSLLQDDRKERVDRYLSCNILKKFSLEEIAQYAGMNRTYFCLFFKKNYGVSLTDYVNKQRVEVACGMLRQGNIPVSDVAKACGFPTVTYFNRVFKKIMGISPREL